MGWILVNILMPVVLPMLLLSVFKLTHLPDPFANRVAIKTLIQHGQLSWITMCLAISATYEIFVVMVDVAQRPSPWVGMFLFMAMILLILSCVTALVATLFPTLTNVGDELGASGQSLREDGLFVMSVVLFALTAVFYSLIHFNG